MRQFPVPVPAFRSLVVCPYPGLCRSGLSSAGLRAGRGSPWFRAVPSHCAPEGFYCPSCRAAIASQALPGACPVVTPMSGIVPCVSRFRVPYPQNVFRGTPYGRRALGRGRGSILPKQTAGPPVALPFTWMRYLFVALILCFCCPAVREALCSGSRFRTAALAGKALVPRWVGRWPAGEGRDCPWARVVKNGRVRPVVSEFVWGNAGIALNWPGVYDHDSLFRGVSGP